VKRLRRRIVADLEGELEIARFPAASVSSRQKVVGRAALHQTTRDCQWHLDMVNRSESAGDFHT